MANAKEKQKMNVLKKNDAEIQNKNATESCGLSSVDLINICRSLQVMSINQLTYWIQNLSNFNSQQNDLNNRNVITFICNNYKTFDAKLISTLPKEKSLNINDSLSESKNYFYGKTKLNSLTQIPSDILNYITHFFTFKYEDLIQFMLTCRYFYIVGSNDFAVYNTFAIIDEPNIFKYNTPRFQHTKSLYILKQCMRKIQNYHQHISKVRLNPKWGSNVFKLQIGGLELFEDYEIFPRFTKVKQICIDECNVPWMIFNYIADPTLLIHIELKCISVSKELIESITKCINIRRLKFEDIEDINIDTNHNVEFDGLEIIYNLSQFIKTELIINLNNDKFPLRQLEEFEMSANVLNQYPTDMDLFIFWILANCNGLKFTFNTGINRFGSSLMNIFAGPMRSHCDDMLFGDTLNNKLQRYIQLFKQNEKEYDSSKYVEFIWEMSERGINNISELYLLDNLWNAMIICNNMEMFMEDKKNYKFDVFDLSMLLEGGEDDTKHKADSVNICNCFNRFVECSEKSELFVEYAYYCTDDDIFTENNFINLWGKQFENINNNDKKIVKCFDNIYIHLYFTFVIEEKDEMKYANDIMNNVLNPWFMNVNQKTCNELQINKIEISCGLNFEQNISTKVNFKKNWELTMTEKYVSCDWSIDASERQIQFVLQT
eukprot:60611_1